MPPASRRQANVIVALLVALLALELLPHLESAPLAVAGLLVFLAVVTGIASLLTGEPA